jgi:hypothetical protein
MSHVVIVDTCFPPLASAQQSKIKPGTSKRKKKELRKTAIESSKKRRITEDMTRASTIKSPIKHPQNWNHAEAAMEERESKVRVI